MIEDFATTVEAEDGTVLLIHQTLDGDEYVTTRVENLGRIRCYGCENRVLPASQIEVLATCKEANRKLRVTDAPRPEWCPKVAGRARQTEAT